MQLKEMIQMILCVLYPASPSDNNDNDKWQYNQITRILTLIWPTDLSQITAVLPYSCVCVSLVPHNFILGTDSWVYHLTQDTEFHHYKGPCCSALITIPTSLSPLPTGPLPLAGNKLFFIFITLSFQECYVNGIIWCATF